MGLHPASRAVLEVPTRLGPWDGSLDLPEPGSSRVGPASRVSVQLLIHSARVLIVCRVLGVMLRAGDIEAKIAGQKPKLPSAPQARETRQGLSRIPPAPTPPSTDSEASGRK